MFDIEKAIIFLVKAFENVETKKPTILHSIRVWLYLMQNNYDKNIVIAWILHDVLEDTFAAEKEIISNFWEEVCLLVKANTKNLNLDKSQILDELVKRCSENENSLIIKSSDILDNYKYYLDENKLSELQRCKDLWNLVLKYKKPNYNDKIFTTLKQTLWI